MPPAEDAYLLDNAWELAKARFAGLELACDPETFAGFERLGVGPGWRCLEAGAGSGSVARWLARRVAPSGHVLAVDLDTRHVIPPETSALERAALTVAQDDIRTIALTPASFDLVHTRAFLVHLPQREAVLARFLEALRPGGVALVEEPDWGLNDAAPGTSSEAAALYRKVLAAIHAVLESRGMSSRFGLALPHVARGVGFEVVETRGYTQVVQGGSEASRFESLTYLQLGALTCAAGQVSAAEYEAFLELLRDPTFAYVRGLICCASLRRPS